MSWDSIRSAISNHISAPDPHTQYLPKSGGQMTGQLSTSSIKIGGWVSSARTYSVNTATPLPMLDADGNPLTATKSYKARAYVGGTGTQTGASCLLIGDGTSAFTLIKIYEAGTSSNHVEFYLNGSVPSVRLYSHASLYTVNVLLEELSNDSKLYEYDRFLSISSSQPQWSGNTMWHAGNDGVGSGLDADKLDGFQSDTAATSNTIALRGAGGGITATAFSSTVATGSSPLIVSSTTQVTNLNSDMTDGFHATIATNSNTIAVRGPAGNLDATTLSLAASTGNIPMTILSTTMVPNLNADMVDGIHATYLMKGVGDVAYNAAPPRSSAYRVITSGAGMLYPASFGVGVSMNGGNGGGEYTLHLYKAGSDLYMQQTADGGAITLAGWQKFFNPAAENSFGSAMTAMTTAEFITLLTSMGAFGAPYYWISRGTWSYANNKYITDTGYGNLHLAGCTVEVIGGAAGCYTIRIHQPTTDGIGGSVAGDFIYINNGSAYSPGWRRMSSDLEKRTSDPVSPAVGRMWLRTDL